MLESLKSFVEKIQLFSSEDKLLLALSGGIDSMVMLELCLKLGNELIVCHVNHGLRGIESDGDEKFIQKVCNGYKIDFFSINIGDQLKSLSSGNMHALARKLRYGFFNKILKEHRAQYILTAHHQDDVLEGHLHNLLRGTGLNGLKGMAIQHRSTIRPLLAFNKEEIRTFAKNNHIKFREDSSNEDVMYNRNKIRHELIPLLEEIFPNSKSRLQKSIQNLKADYKLLQSYIENEILRFNVLQNGRMTIDKKALSKCLHPVEVLYSIIKEHGFTRTQSANIINSLASSNTFITNKKWKLINQREILKLEKSTQLESFQPLLIADIKDEGILHLPNDIEINYVCSAYQSTLLSKYDACLDLDKLTLPLVIRSWSKGEFFKPIGMNGRSQKIVKFLREQKLPTNAKQEQLVLTSNGTVTWVIPFRISEDFKATERTKTVICFNYYKSSST